MESETPAPRSARRAGTVPGKSATEGWEAKTEKKRSQSASQSWCSRSMPSAS